MDHEQLALPDGRANETARAFVSFLFAPGVCLGKNTGNDQNETGVVSRTVRGSLVTVGSCAKTGATLVSCSVYGPSTSVAVAWTILLFCCHWMMPLDKQAFFEFSLCLSLACLSKLVILMEKVGGKTVFSPVVHHSSCPHVPDSTFAEDGATP